MAEKTSKKTSTKKTSTKKTSIKKEQPAAAPTKKEQPTAIKPSSRGFRVKPGKSLA